MHAAATRHPSKIHMNAAVGQKATVDIVDKNMELTTSFQDDLECRDVMSFVFFLLFLYWSPWPFLGFPRSEFFTSLKLENRFVH